MAQNIQTVTTDVGELNASVTTLAQSVDGLEASWGVRVEAGPEGEPVVGGLKITATGEETDFAILTDVLRIISQSGTGLLWGDGILWNKGTTYSVLIGHNFGTTGDLMFWAGPTPETSSHPSKSNGVFWIDAGGDAYFGGSLSAGVISNAGQTTLSTATEFTLGPFGSNGEGVNVVVFGSQTRLLASDPNTWEAGGPELPDPYTNDRLTVRESYKVESSTDGGSTWTFEGNHTADTTSWSRIVGAGLSPPPEPVPLRRWQHIITTSVSRTLTVNFGAGSGCMVRLTRLSTIDVSDGTEVPGMNNVSLSITTTEE